MDRGAWWATVHGVAKTRLSEHFHFLPTLVWRWYLLFGNHEERLVPSLSHPLIEQFPNMELCSMLCASLDGRGVWGRMDPCMCMAESLCCSPKTTVLIGYTPIQNNKKVQKKRKIWCPSSFIVFLHTHTQKEENIKIVFKTARYFRDIFKLKKKKLVSFII